MTAREEVRVFNDEFSAAAARGDAKALVDMYDDEAVFLMAGLPNVKGREELTKLFDEFLAKGPVEMAFESGDVWESGDLIVDVGTTAAGGNPGRYVVVYRRQSDGSLAMLVDAPIRSAEA